MTSVKSLDPFPSTHWSLVLAAGENGTPDLQKSFEKLYVNYWRPLIGYAQRLGHNRDDEKDLVQGFFLYLISKNAIHKANPDRGRFRTFLLCSFQNYIATEWAKSHAAKRGGVCGAISLELLGDEYLDGVMDVPANMSPSFAFDRQWANEVFANALNLLRESYRVAGNEKKFDHLKSM